MAELGVKRIRTEAYEFPPINDASELSSTVMVPNLTSKLPREKNLVYCATQKLLEVVKDQTMGIPTSMEGIADELPKGSYRFFDGTIEEVRNQLDDGVPSTTQTLEFLSGEGRLWCCHFQRSLPFMEAFERLEEPLKFRSSSGIVKVACFGDRRFEEDSVQQALRKEQITVVDFRSEDDFVVRLNTDQEEDELILAKVDPEESLESTLKGVMQRVTNNPLEGSEQSSIQDGEALVVPILTVNILKRFSPGFQTIRFRLDERGAKLDSIVAYGSLGDDVVLRQMVFDKPFLLYIKSKIAGVPYFVLWVENLELMEAFVTEAKE